MSGVDDTNLNQMKSNTFHMIEHHFLKNRLAHLKGNGNYSSDPENSPSKGYQSANEDEKTNL